MGNAFQELIEDGRMEGREEIADEIKKLRASGMNADQILQKIEQSVNRSARARKKGS